MSRTITKLADPAHGTFTNYKTWVYQDLNNDGKPDYPIVYYGTQNFRRLQTVVETIYERKGVATNGAACVLNLRSSGVHPGKFDFTQKTIAPYLGEGMVRNIYIHDGIIDGMNDIIDGDYSDNAYNDKQFQYNIQGTGAWDVTIRNIQSLGSESDHISL